MKNKAKKLFILGAMVSSMFMALTACDFSHFISPSNPSNQDADSNSSKIPDNAVLENIVVINNKDGYERGEELDLTVTAYYSSDFSINVTDYEVSGYNNKETGNQTITVTYEDKSFSLDVFVREPVLLSISALSNKQSYEYGEELDIIVTANYSDGSSKQIENYQINGYNACYSGEQNLLISYENQSCSLKVKVNDPIITNIALEGYKQSYEYGEELDIVVTATYSDGSTATITDYTVEGFDNKKPGNQEVTISYYGKNSSFNTVVNNPVMTGISVSGNKNNYEYGEELDIIVTANYSDDSAIKVSNYQVEGFDNKKPGEQTVTIKYEDKTYSFNVTVNDPVLVSITAVSNKETYEYGDNLDVVVVATYSDDSQIEIKNYQVEGFDSRKEGEQTLTFSFEGKTCTLKVGVNAKRNRFPADKLASFLNSEGIKTNVPSLVGYFVWSDKVELEQDGANYFITTTKDEGTVGIDSLADQYAIALTSKGWTVNKNNGGYTALKKDGDVQMSFSTKAGLFSLRVESYSEYPTKKFVGTVVGTKSSLGDGDKIVIANPSEGFIASGFEDGSLKTIECSSSDDSLSNIARNAWRFTVNKVGSYFTLSDIHGRKLGTKGIGQLAWDEGELQWNLLITAKSALIMSVNTNYGRLCFNTYNESISTYSKTSSDTYLIYPQIFKINETDLVYPTSFTLDGKSSIGIGKTNQLSVNFYPKDSNTVETINWSSSNEAVATVDNGVVTGVSAGAAIITAKCKSKGQTLESTFKVEIKEMTLDSWTIMLYVCGSNLESDDYTGTEYAGYGYNGGNIAGYASQDIDEILQVTGQPDDVNIIIETGGTTKWKKYGIDANALSRYHVENKQLVLDEKLTKVNMGKRSTFESFLTWGLQEYPADKVGVIFWNHGGALGGVCYDDSIGSSDSLTNSETYQAYQNILPANGIDKLEFVGYDACLMQVQDIAEFNSHYFNYMVGSEETEVGDGWVYNTWIDDVYAGKDTATILKATCDGFISKNGGDQTMSYLDLSKMSDYFEKFEAMAAAIKSTAKSNYSSFKNILSSVKSFGDYYYTSGLHSYGTIDGYDLLNKLSSNATYSAYTNQINEVKSAYSSLVAYSKKGSKAGQAYGLVVIAGVYISYSTSETSFTNWRSIFK